MRWGREVCDGVIRPRACAACVLHSQGWPRLAASLPDMKSTRICGVQRRMRSANSTPFVPGPPDTPSYRSIVNGATGVPTTGQRLVWYGGPWAHVYDIYFGTDSSASTLVAANQPLGPSDTTSKTQSYALPSLQAGTTYYWKIVSKTAAMVSRTGPVWSFTTGGSSSGGQLPVPWLDRDIGSVGVAGSAQFSNGTFTVRASGADVWGAADAFHYAYQPWSGDGSIVARVADVTNTSAWAKAGVMFRASLDAGSAHAFMLVSAANGVSFQRRPTTGGTSVGTNVAGVTPPRWVRLDRSGNTFTASYSSDGTSWTLVATDTITMPQDLFVGMAVTSHNNTSLSTATLESVTVSQGPDTGGGGPPPPWLEQDIGSVAIAGSAQSANGTFTIKASGADIWGTADAFHYVYQPWTGDGSIIARVGSVTNTNAWAKAGVMFRETTGAGSRHALMLLSAANGVSFLRRGATGGTSVSTTIAGVTAPRWVRLDRSGDTFTAYHSSDGATWTLVGTETIAMPASIFVGMAVTSHNNTALTTATFTTVANRMRNIFNVANSKITITYTYVALGFAGGPPIPSVTVTVSGVPYDTILTTLMASFFARAGGASTFVNLPTMSVTMTGEDLSTAGAS